MYPTNRCLAGGAPISAPRLEITVLMDVCHRVFDLVDNQPVNQRVHVQKEKICIAYLPGSTCFIPRFRMWNKAPVTVALLWYIMIKYRCWFAFQWQGLQQPPRISPQTATNLNGEWMCHILWAPVFSCISPHRKCESSAGNLSWPLATACNGWFIAISNSLNCSWPTSAAMGIMTYNYVTPWCPA